MKKESIVVQRLKNYGSIVKRGYKNALNDLDEGLGSAISLAIATGKVDAYNDMVKILKGGSAFTFDTKPESYYVSGFKVEDLEYVDKDSPLN